MTGRIPLEHYRGRSVYSFPVQAAERAVREHARLFGIGDLTFLGSKAHGGEAWRVRFRAPDDAIHEVAVAAVVADESVYLTCDAAEPKRPRRYDVTAHRVVSR